MESFLVSYWTHSERRAASVPKRFWIAHILLAVQVWAFAWAFDTGNIKIMFMSGFYAFAHLFVLYRGYIWK